jgi:putative transposase
MLDLRSSIQASHPINLDPALIASVFCQTFSPWYDGEHHHSGIGLMTSEAVHDGRASALRDARQRVLRAAYAAHPERFVRKPPQPPVLPNAVWINQPKEQSASQDRAGDHGGACATLSRLRHTRFYTKCPRQVSQSC